MKAKNIYLCFILVFFFMIPHVFAGGNDDDLTFSYAFDHDKYYYGDIVTCNPNMRGDFEFFGIRLVYGLKAPYLDYELCIWDKESAAKNQNNIEFKCLNETYDKFYAELSGSNGKTYYGYGCRKLTDELNRDTFDGSKELNIGDIEYIQNFHSSDSTSSFRYTCEVISGDSVYTMGGSATTACMIDARKTGESIVRVHNTYTGEAKYYKYIVVSAEDDPSDPTPGGTPTDPTPGGTPSEPEKNNCESIFGSPEYNPHGINSPAFYIVTIFNVIKYVALIILIVLSILDFVGAISSQDSDSLKRASQKLVIRFVICVVLFLLPTLLKFLFNYLSERAIRICGVID